MRKGYLTVYLSLSLALILSFILTLAEGARIHTVRMEAECVADIGMNSILAEFHRELLEQYDLLFVDMSYGTDSRFIENTQEHLRSYMQKNFSLGEKNLFPVKDWLVLSVDKAAIEEYFLASDDEGNGMRRQALDYMKESSAEGMLSGMAEKIESQIILLEGLGLDTRDIDSERNSIQAQIDAVELPKEEDSEGNMIEKEFNNPADKIDAIRGTGILDLVIKSKDKISAVSVNTKQYISHRERSAGRGKPPDYRRPQGISSRIFFDEYLFEKCSRYGKELDKSLLKYQIEYILAGESSDRANLGKTAKKLLTWREVANVIYILSDSAKCAEAQALAISVTAALQVPALAEPVKYAILFAWAYVESICDVRSLMAGGKVPIIKTNADWRTSIGNITDFNGSIPEGGEESNGLSYEDYLRIMLFLKDDTEKNLRTMDIMEMDIRKTPGNTHFKMDGCFDSFLADIIVSSGFGYHCEIRKRYGYD